jgi:hypothetical protein
MWAGVLGGWKEKDRSDSDEGKRGRDGKQADYGDHDPRQVISHLFDSLSPSASRVPQLEF